MNEESKNDKYNPKSDFVNLAIIILLIVTALGGLYFYDQQSDILITASEQVKGMF